jgi:hypothetical protein
MSLNSAPISSGWGDAKSGPVSIWALWFKNLYNENDTYLTTTNITHGGTLTSSVKITKVGRQVTVILTYSDTVSTSSTVGTTTFSLPYVPVSTSVASAINATTHASLGNGYVAVTSTHGYLYVPTATSGAGEVVVITATYFS